MLRTSFKFSYYEHEPQILEFEQYVQLGIEHEIHELFIKVYPALHTTQLVLLKAISQLGRLLS